MCLPRWVENAGETWPELRPQCVVKWVLWGGPRALLTYQRYWGVPGDNRIEHCHFRMGNRTPSSPSVTKIGFTSWWVSGQKTHTKPKGKRRTDFTIAASQDNQGSSPSCVSSSSKTGMV